MESDPRVWIATLRRSHDRLVGLIGPLTPDELRAQSYCKDWSIAQVLSHLGSGAEIAVMNLPGALGQGEPADREAYVPVWDRWNAMSPDDQAAAALIADAQHIGRLEQLSDAELASISFSFFGMTLDAVKLVRLRLGEHSLHTWDIAVMSDPAAVVAPDAAELLVDAVPEFLAPRLGKPQAEPLHARIKVSDPDRDYLLVAADAVSMTDWPADGVADLHSEVAIPAEALLRLAYGRLDPEHTPASLVAEPAVLDRLRAVFPGF
jgi:uncharacterized protein (TIGR03083 family)